MISNTALQQITYADLSNLDFEAETTTITCGINPAQKTKGTNTLQVKEREKKELIDSSSLYNWGKNCYRLTRSYSNDSKFEFGLREHRIWALLVTVDMRP
jgi:hypothetical protein